MCEGALRVPNAICVNSDVPVSDLKGYIEAVRKHPALGSVGTSSLGSVGAFLVHLMRKTTGADLRLVAYRGGLADRLDR